MTDLFDLFVDETPAIAELTELPFDAVLSSGDTADGLFDLTPIIDSDIENAVIDAESYDDANILDSDYELLGNRQLGDDYSVEGETGESSMMVDGNEGGVLDMLPVDSVDTVSLPVTLGAAPTEDIPAIDLQAPLLESSLWDSITKFIHDMDDFYLRPLLADDALVAASDFSGDGAFDNKNNLIVVGNVAHDIQYVDQQTGPTCSLMAQEQFVHRYIGKSLPEDYLAWRGEEWGVYAPSGLEAGTNYFGQTMILDHFDIPYERSTFNWLNTTTSIDKALDADKDLIVGVDAREFYSDSTIPPGSGHAVAVVGKGVDPATNETSGFYITDSNNPGTSRFMDVASFNNAWLRDMIAIPNPPTEVA